ncbi:MAG: hypothetical protein ACKOTE_01150, partial [Opitutaceae bacterium]
MNPALPPSFAVRALLVAVLLPAVRAQVAPATDTLRSAATEAPLTLTPFVVEEAEDRGYAATSTLAGTRLRTELRDVGAAISVVTAQFLADTASTNVRDLLVYTTNTEAEED